MKSTLPTLPAPLATLLGDCRRELVVTGLSSARVERITPLDGSVMFLKAAPAGGPHPVGDEIVRLEWMAEQHLPVPAIVAQLVHADVQYLLTEALPGWDASASPRAGMERFIVAALGSALRRLHATPIARCPFRHDARSRVEEAARRVRDRYVDETDFDASRLGRTATDVLSELITSHERLAMRRPSGAGVAEDMVFTHGDYCLPNIILRGAPSAAAVADGSSPVALSGFVDCGRAGVADRYQDLALGARSVTLNLGVEWVPAFLEAYGLRVVDEERMEFYTLLDEFF